MRVRIALCAAGIALGLFGVFRILTQVPGADVLVLIEWPVVAVILHDGILSLTFAGIGAGLARVLPSRARRFVAPALVVGGLITVIALPLIYRENTQPASKAVLRQNYAGNLALLLAIVAAVMFLAYVLTVLRERRGRGPAAGSVRHRRTTRPRPTNGALLTKS